MGTLDRADQGLVELDGVNLDTLSGAALSTFRNQKIGFVFQFHYLLPEFTVLENVMLPLRLQPDFHFKQSEQKALAWLERVGLSRQAQQTPKVLSGGEQQRVAIARALIAEPKIIFADEPTGNLDGQTAEEIEQLLFDLNRELSTTLVLVTHDQNLAALCQRHVKLVDGQIQEIVKAEERI